jgi:hypothetical protein
MELVKKNIVSIVCGVIALVAIVLLFFPGSGFFQDLQAQLDQRKQDYSTIEKINRDGQNVRMPIVQPGVSEAPPLGQFPTNEAFKKGEELVAQMAKQSQGVMQKAIERNKRAPLVATAFPKPRGAALPEFKRLYHQRMRDGFRQQLRGTVPPNPTEVAAERERLWNEEWLPKVPVQGGQRVNENVVKEEFEEKVVPTLPDQLRVARSQAGAVYIHEPVAQGGFMGSFDISKDIPRPETQQIPTLVDAWAAQLSLWVQEDVVATIVATNAARGPQSTTDRSIVKRLVKVEVTPAYITKAGPLPIAQANQAANARAGQPPVDPALEQAGGAADLAKVYTVSPTGRVCNSLYDVIHFSFTVDVEADQYQAVLANLANNRFITVHGIDLLALDGARYQAAGLVYGPKPVVQMTVKAETIFFREWTKPLMPEPVQQLLGIPPAQPGNGAVARY